MKTLTMLCAAGLFAAGCKKHETPPPPVATGSGSAAMASGSAAAVGAAVKLTGDDVVKHYQQCWADWVAGKWDDVKACYANDAVWEAPGSKLGPINGAAAIVELDKSYRAAFPNETAESQLVLVNGKKVVGVVLLTGKQTGTLKLPSHDLPPTNNQFGVYAGQVLALDDAGKITHEWSFEDMATVLGQLKPSKDHPVRAAVTKLASPEQVVVSTGDPKEKANLASFQQLTDAFNKHDVKAFGALLGDAVVWSQQAMAKDESKKELETDMPALWKAFSDVKLTVSDVWAAGDYVAATETFEGTNDGDLPAMHLKKTGKKVSIPMLAIHKVELGKVTATWIFDDGADFARQLGTDTKLSKN